MGGGLISVGYLDETPGDGGRLGRHIEHDPASREYGVPVAPYESLDKSCWWNRQSPILDQGNLGSCTGNALAGALGTDSVNRKGSSTVDEDLALRLYEDGTHLDHIRGSYPPDDTGSTGLAVSKAARKLGMIRAYYHAFSLRAMIKALQSGPVIVGMAWRTGCDNPDPSGMVSYDGPVRGGHEVLFRGFDAATGQFWADNSWGPDWGAKGSFLMTSEDLRVALADYGDVTVPVW